MSAHEFTFVSIDAKPLPLKAFVGRPILLVNTASACGYTPQYASLQRLWEAYRERGLVLLAVPCNDFGAQEPGTALQIKNFCADRYNVNFPLTTKERVVGADAHPLYRWIFEQVGEAGAPRWNFHKYLLDGNGHLVDTWPSKVDPLDADIIGTIEALLSGELTISE